MAYRLRSSLADRDAIEREHRARILDATVSIASVAGYAEMSIAAILAHAGVQRRTFNSMFRDKEDAFLAAYGSVVGELSDALVAEDDPTADPSVRVATAVATAIAFLRADPVRAEIMLLEVHAAGPNAVDLLQDVVERMVDGAAGLLAQAGSAEPPVRLRAEIAVGAVHEALRSSLVRGELDRLPALTPELLRVAFPTLAADRLPAVGMAEGYGPSRPSGTT